MKMVALVFLITAYGAAKGLVVADATTNTNEELDYPHFNAPELVLPCIGCGSGCNWFTLCLNVVVEVVADGIEAIAVILIYVIKLLYEIASFVVGWVVFIASLVFSGIDDAPWWVNLMLNLPFGLGFALITFKLIRAGSSTA